MFLWPWKLLLWESSTQAFFINNSSGSCKMQNGHSLTLRKLGGNAAPQLVPSSTGGQVHSASALTHQPAGGARSTRAWAAKKGRGSKLASPFHSHEGSPFMRRVSAYKNMLRGSARPHAHTHTLTLHALSSGSAPILYSPLGVGKKPYSFFF